MDIRVAIALAGFCYYIAGCFEGIMDFLIFKYNGDHKFWNYKIASANKWKAIELASGNRVERFLGSSTIFVFTTCGWHLTKWIRNRFIDLSVTFVLATEFKFWVAFLFVCGFRIAYGLGFEWLWRGLQKSQEEDN